MIDEKVLLKKIQVIYRDNSDIILENIDGSDSYYLGKNMAYIEVNNIIKELIENNM